MLEALTHPLDQTPAGSRHWLLAGTLALGLGGLYALPLIVGRGLIKRDPARFQALFDMSLVVHVDLTILIWFLSMTLLCWDLFLPPRSQRLLPLPFFRRASQILLYAATVTMVLSPFAGGEGLKSNYIPMLENGVFGLSLVLLACALALGIVETLLGHRPRHLFSRSFGRAASFEGSLALGAYGAMLITFVALWCFWQSAERIGFGYGEGETAQAHYELVYWAGGHLIQFTYAQVMMIAWVMLAIACGIPLASRARWLSVLLLITPIGAMLAFPLYRHPVDSAEFRNGFTRLMIEFNGLAPLLLAVTIVALGWIGRAHLACRSASFFSLTCSLLVFGSGGVLGLLIREQNVTIPAHYHGSIVGVTLALMGLAYLLLPRFGYADPSRWRLTRWQPATLAAGQLLHVGGLAWSGGYGVLRKTVEAGGDYPPAVRIAFGMIGAGGLLAIIGGAMFVVVVCRCLSGRDARKAVLNN